MERRGIVLFPVAVFALAFVLTLGMTESYAESVWNWWYVLMLPGMIAVFCYLSVSREKKTKYCHMMTLPEDKGKLMLCKILYIGCAILASNIIIFAGAFVGGTLLTTSVPVGGAVASVFVLWFRNCWYASFCQSAESLRHPPGNGLFCLPQSLEEFVARCCIYCPTVLRRKSVIRF